MDHNVGELIAGRYRVQTVLARGDAVTLYTALDAANGQAVGIRHWRADPARERAAAAELEREAQLTTRLQHVHLLRHVDHLRVETPHGVDFYLVHEACAGQTLADWVQEGSRSDADVRAIAAQLLRLADHLHRQSPAVVHGAIRPDNILRRSDGRLYVTGFRPGWQPGSGEAPLGPEADLRAIAETLVHVIAGRPASGPWAHSAALADVPRDLRRWLERMLTTNPAARFTSATEALRALRQPARRSRLAVAIALVALVMMGVTVAGGIAVMRWFDARLRPSQPIASRSQLAKPIEDTRFVPRAGDTAGGLRLVHRSSMLGHWSAVFDVRFDASGNTIASASYDGSVRLWNAHDGTPRQTFAHGGKVGAVAFAGTDRLCSGGNTDVRVWEIATGRMVHSLPADARQVTAIATGSSGRHVLSGGFEGALRVFELESGRLVHSMTQPGRVLAVAADPGGERLASGGDDGVVRVFRFEGGALEVQLRGHTGPVNDVVFSADGQTLVSAGDDRTIRVWYVRAGQPMHTLSGHRDQVWAIALDPTGKQLASASKDGELRLWDLYTGKLELQQQVDPRGVIALAYSADGKRLAVGGGGQRIDVYELRVTRPSWRPPAITAPIKPVPFKLPKDVSAEMALVLEARELLNETEGGRDQEKIDLLSKRALALNPRSAPALVESARLAQQQGYRRGSDYTPESLRRSDELLQRALALDPNLYEAQLRLAYSLLQRDDFARSTEAAQRAERLRPGDPRTQVLLMNLADDQKQDEQLMLHARALIESSDDRRNLRIAYAKLRDVYEHRDELDAADDMYRSVINLDPDSAWSKGNYANFLVRHERYDDAIEWAQAAIAQMDYGAARSTLAEAYARKAHAALEQGDEAAFERWLGQAFHAFPGSGEAHYVRGMYHRRKHDEGRARVEFEAALRSEPDHRRASEALNAKL